jgi:hypothetical protein
LSERGKIRKEICSIEWRVNINAVKSYRNVRNPWSSFSNMSIVRSQCSDTTLNREGELIIIKYEKGIIWTPVWE